MTHRRLSLGIAALWLTACGSSGSSGGHTGTGGSTDGSSGSGGATGSGGTGGAAASCPTTVLTPGDHNETITSGGESRTFIVHVPTVFKTQSLP